MGYRERRDQARAQSKQRRGALGFALMSGHGAALFLSILTPLQLIGRVPPEVLGAVMLVGAGAAAAFGLGVASAWNALNADGDGASGRAEEFLKGSLDIAMKALVTAVILLALVGATLLVRPNDESQPAKAEISGAHP